MILFGEINSVIWLSVVSQSDSNIPDISMEVEKCNIEPSPSVDTVEEDVGNQDTAEEEESIYTQGSSL